VSVKRTVKGTRPEVGEADPEINDVDDVGDREKLVLYVSAADTGCNKKTPITRIVSSSIFF
jgi:hypothetical protein